MLNEGAWPVAEMRSALKVTGQGCCAWRGRPPGARGRRDAGLPAKISEICAPSRGVYGAPKVFAELKRAGGEEAEVETAEPETAADAPEEVEAEGEEPKTED